MSIPFPNKPWSDKQTFKYFKSDGTEVIATYNASKNAWTLYTVNEDGVMEPPGIITTDDVRTTSDAPVKPTGYNGLNLQEDLNYLTNQKLVNWFLAAEILINKEDIQKIIWIDEDPPENNDYLFWFNTDELALYVWNDAWFPVSSIGEGGVSTEIFTYTIGQIQRLIDEVYLKNIEQDNRLDVIEENIVELEEEIDAIAPSVERGEWTFSDIGVAAPGEYALLDENAAVTDTFSQARLIFVSTTDADSNPHGFNNHEPGELLQIFNKEDNQYGLYEIKDIDDNSGNSQNPYFSFTVDFVRAYSNFGKAVRRGRFKFFNAPQGGTADGFVLKTGDSIPCDSQPIVFPNEFNNNNLKANSADVQARIKFSGKNINDDSTQVVSIWQPGRNKALMTDGSFYTKNNVYAKYIKGWDGTNEKTPSIFLNDGPGHLQHNGNDRVQWGSDGVQLKVGTNVFLKHDNTNGKLQYRSSDRLEWSSSGVSIPKPVNNSTNADGFKIVGSTTANNNYTQNSIGSETGALFVVKHVDDKPDHIEYRGKITESTDITNKEYVDDQIATLLQKIEELEMTGGGGGKNNRLYLETRDSYSSNAIGNSMQRNTFSTMSSVDDRYPWQNLTLKAFDATHGYLFICFDDDSLSLQPQGTLHLIKESNGNSTYDNSDRSLKVVVSEAVKCPDEYNSGKNIWRCVIQPDLYISDFESHSLGSFNSGSKIYITFTGGSLIKTSTS